MPALGDGTLCFAETAICPPHPSLEYQIYLVKLTSTQCKALNPSCDWHLSIGVAYLAMAAFTITELFVQQQ